MCTTPCILPHARCGPATRLSVRRSGWSRSSVTRAYARSIGSSTPPSTGSKCTDTSYVGPTCGDRPAATPLGLHVADEELLAVVRRALAPGVDVLAARRPPATDEHPGGEPLQVTLVGPVDPPPALDQGVHDGIGAHLRERLARLEQQLTADGLERLEVHRTGQLETLGKVQPRVGRRPDQLLLADVHARHRTPGSCCRTAGRG